MASNRGQLRAARSRSWRDALGRWPRRRDAARRAVGPPSADNDTWTHGGGGDTQRCALCVAVSRAMGKPKVDPRASVLLLAFSPRRSRIDRRRRRRRRRLSSAPPYLRGRPDHMHKLITLVPSNPRWRAKQQSETSSITRSQRQLIIISPASPSLWLLAPSRSE